MRFIAQVTSLVMLGFLAACASAPAETYVADGADDSVRLAAAYAQDMVGKPYRYGGNSPSGFDCSGLVHYSFTRAGISIPRTTRTQLDVGQAVDGESLQVGDLVFFDQEGLKFSHVGIYIGNRRFVHAPSSGKRVRIDSLDVEYWQQHFTAARRI